MNKHSLRTQLALRIERLRNYWRRWGLHKARADAEMWQEIAEEERALAHASRAAALRGWEATERYELSPLDGPNPL